MRFLLSRRWVLFAITVALLAWLAVQLGEWQFNRLEDRRESNERIGRNLEAPPAPVAELMSPDRPPAEEDEWRRVSVTGTWDDARTLVVKYRTRDQSSGVEVVTPLRTVDGTAVLVDRGWLGTENNSVRPELPSGEQGEVTVVGWVRRDATGDAARISDMATRAISSRSAAEVLPYPVYRGFVDLESQQPEPVMELAPVEPPDHEGSGPHFFYGLQWWFFGALAVFGFCYLAFDEWRQRRSGGTGPRTRPRPHPRGSERA